MHQEQAEFNQEDLAQQRQEEQQDRVIYQAALEEQFQLGDKASQILKWLEAEGSLFLEVFRQLQQEQVDGILALPPERGDEFTIMKAKLDILYEPLNRLRLMKEMGIAALEELKLPGKGGIL
jgi:hypothetical protein